ncbi:MAG TPA: hypothetical protein VN249_09935 [Prolixibacteraceae bacterium]|nr:hypothetical protein [Prolixibacteraceae bacterium]
MEFGAKIRAINQNFRYPVSDFGMADPEKVQRTDPKETGRE